MLPSGRVTGLPQTREGRVHLVGVVLLALSVAIVSLTARVTYGQISDPWGTLLVSKALVTNGTIRLDTLGIPHLDLRLGYRLFERGGHQYLVYPLGTPVLAAPVVGLAQIAGVDVADEAGERRVQRVASALVAVLTVVALLGLARRLLPPGPALACTAVFWAGTSLASTSGATLWSHNLAVLFALYALDLVVRAEIEGRRVSGGGLGLCLWLAYLCRPTMAAFAGLVLAWTWTRDRQGAARAAAVLAGGMALFAACSRAEFGEWLPPYYRMGLSGGTFSGAAMWGLLFNPSRGLLVFSPVLAAVWATRALGPTRWPLGRAWWLVALGWPALLVVALGRWEMWWGGGCFGPRLLTDALPAAFLLTLRAWPVRRPHGTRWVGMAALVAAAGVSIAIHVGQGLYNPWTLTWNREPSVDTEPWARASWRFPQFLHTGDRHRDRMAAYFARVEPSRPLGPVRPGETVRLDDPRIDVLGFDRMRAEGRWTRLQVAEVLFVPAVEEGQAVALVLTYGTNGRQRVRVELNDAVVFEGVLEAETAVLTLPVPAHALVPRVNRLRFVLPDTRRIRRGDPGEYGIVIRAITMNPK